MAKKKESVAQPQPEPQTITGTAGIESTEAFGKTEAEVTVEPGTMADTDCGRMALCVSLGEPGSPEAEGLQQVILVTLNERTISEAGAALQALYDNKPIEEQRKFVERLDFVLGRLRSASTNLKGAYTVK